MQIPHPLKAFFDPSPQPRSSPGLPPPFTALSIPVAHQALYRSGYWIVSALWEGFAGTLLTLGRQGEGLCPFISPGILSWTF